MRNRVFGIFKLLIWRRARDNNTSPLCPPARVINHLWCFLCVNTTRNRTAASHPHTRTHPVMLYIQFVDCSYCTSITNIIKCTQSRVVYRVRRASVFCQLRWMRVLARARVCVYAWEHKPDNPPSNNTLYEYYMQIRRRGGSWTRAPARHV